MSDFVVCTRFACLGSFRVKNLPFKVERQLVLIAGGSHVDDGMRRPPLGLEKGVDARLTESFPAHVQPAL